MDQDIFVTEILKHSSADPHYTNKDSKYKNLNILGKPYYLGLTEYGMTLSAQSLAVLIK